MSNSKKWTGKEVRKTFVDFFCEKNNHTFVKSSSVVPKKDPTLLFTNAGMNQFKPLFLGLCEEGQELYGLKRASNSQKCIRAGGKHNDLEDVGSDTYHHTFFEMLGNWSFGDYFKKEAISWAWELLTKVYCLDEKRLYASYFGGDEKLGLKPDIETLNIWKQFLPESRILPFGAKENFWEMGETGPCGGCSEIHYDRVGNRDASLLVNADDPNVVEIWNLVFIEFNREIDGSLSVLPNKHVDTGMGFERLTSILQGVMSNYETDMFIPIMNEIQKMTGARAYEGKDLKDKIDIAYRVISDHIRTLSIAISDGVIPENKGRGYVLRRVIRRACRFGKQFLDAKPGFLHQLVDIVVQLLGDVYPSLKVNPEGVKEVILEEETLFNRTLKKGLKRFESMSSKFKKEGIINGEDAFFLYSTCGFPLDLTELMGKEIGVTVDKEQYALKIKEHEEKSRGTKKVIPSIKLTANQLSELSSSKFVPTDDSKKYDWSEELPCKILKIFDGIEFKDSWEMKEEEKEEKFVGLVLDQTSFYYEQGGQAFDVGFITNSSFNFEVVNVQGFGGYIVHTGTLRSPGKIVVGESAVCKPNLEIRKSIASNHTSTHLLNFALRKVLQAEVDQKGSYCGSEYLRFDFNHNKPLSEEEILKVEEIVNDIISKNYKVDSITMKYEDAIKINGLRHMFDETYPENVRVVGMGSENVLDFKEMEKNPDHSKWLDISLELCGGTHLKGTKGIRRFIIVNEGSPQKGLRRIRAITHTIAEESYLDSKNYERMMKKLEEEKDDEYFISARKELYDDVDGNLLLSCVLKKRYMKLLTEKFFDRVKRIQKEKVKKMEKKVDSCVEEDLKNEELKFSCHLFHFEESEMKLLQRCEKGLKKKLKKKMVPFCGFAVSEPKKRVYVLITVPKELKDKVSAMECFTTFKTLLNAKGGGKEMKAQGQGTELKGANEALKLAKEYFEKKL